MGVFRKILSSWILLYSLFSIVVIGGAFYLVLDQEIEATVTRQLLDRKRTIARAEVVNITTFFEKFGNSVATLAQLSSIEASDADAISDLDTFVEQRAKTGLIEGVVLTDKNGVVRFNSNVLGTRDLGESLADRDYFAWAKVEGEKGEYFISQPVVSQVVVASPVYQNNAFSGVVASSVKLAPLAERFLGLMKISDLTEVYLVDGSGDLLYSNSADQSLSSIKNVLSATEEGELRSQTHLIAYSPVILGTQSWLLIISSPALEVVNLTRPFYVRQAGVLILTATTILSLGVIAIRKNYS